ncbi:MAG: hypothetical protein KJP23_03825 [Deltaproteobacteria bacterium]|nr:hypothetical protein [Deltaproteobacteria bacterium]
MSTTAIIVEHLISGLQACIWIFLIVLMLFGYNWINLDRVKAFSTLLTMLTIAILYPIGIFIDDIADFIFGHWSKQIRSARFQKEDIEIDDDKTTAFQLLQDTKDDFLKSYFSYVRMRIRIARSASFNFAVCTVAVVAFTVFRIKYTWDVLVVEFIKGFLFLLFVFAVSG